MHLATFRFGAILPLIAVSTLGLAACSSQPDTPGGRAANERHENFEAIGDAFKTINNELKDSAPNVDQLRASSQVIAGLAPKVQSWFPKGSGPQDKIHTDARPAVWTRPADFQKAAERFAAAATSFDTAAKAGDVAAMQGAAKEMGGACKGCHEQFREKD